MERISILGEEKGFVRISGNRWLELHGVNWRMRGPKVSRFESK